MKLEVLLRLIMKIKNFIKVGIIKMNTKNKKR